MPPTQVHHLSFSAQSLSAQQTNTRRARNLHGQKNGQKEISFEWRNGESNARPFQDKPVEVLMECYTN